MFLFLLQLLILPFLLFLDDLAHFGKNPHTESHTELIYKEFNNNIFLILIQSEKKDLFRRLVGIHLIKRILRKLGHAFEKVSGLDYFLRTS